MKKTILILMILASALLSCSKDSETKVTDDISVINYDEPDAGCNAVGPTGEYCGSVFLCAGSRKCCNHTNPPPPPPSGN